MKIIKLVDKEYDFSSQYSVSDELFDKVKKECEKELKETIEQNDNIDM